MTNTTQIFAVTNQAGQIVDLARSLAEAQRVADWWLRTTGQLHFTG